ncbi:MAG: hypothetical protein OEY64_03230 [Nitrospinota bacterium]|nr:hypothetical protein [Nitrospinota bacterium]
MAGTFVKVDDAAVRKMLKSFPKTAKTSARLAINTTLRHAKTKITKSDGVIRQKRKIKTKKLKDNILILTATGAKLLGKLFSRRSPVSLIYYGARQTRTGVSINVTGTRKVIKHAFITTIGGNKGVYTRKADEHGKRVGRMPIWKLYSTAVDEAFDTDAVRRGFEIAARKFAPEFFRQMKWRLQKDGWILRGTSNVVDTVSSSFNK